MLDSVEYALRRAYDGTADLAEMLDATGEHDLAEEVGAAQVAIANRLSAYYLLEGMVVRPSHVTSGEALETAGSAGREARSNILRMALATVVRRTWQGRQSVLNPPEPEASGSRW